MRFASGGFNSSAAAGSLKEEKCPRCVRFVEKGPMREEALREGVWRKRKAVEAEKLPGYLSVYLNLICKESELLSKAR